jgi:hypothetical protein
VYGQESSSALAATGTGLVIFGSHVSVWRLASIGLGLVLIGAAALIAFRRTRRNRNRRGN